MINLMLITSYAAAVMFFLGGLLLGSFFNVLIYRLPKGLSIVWPGSQCPHCDHPIKPYENIPVISYLYLGGKCGHCKSRISWQYPLIELLTGISMVILWFYLVKPFGTVGQSWGEYAFLSIKALSLLILIPVAVIDIYYYIIPDSISLGGLVLGIAGSLIPGGITPLHSLYGILAGGGTLLVIGLLGQLMLKKEAMGGGDIKLMAFLGAIWGWEIAFLSIIIGSLLGSIISLTLLALKSLPGDHKIPFGPYLSIGTWIAVIYGEFLLNSYLAFIERCIISRLHNLFF